MMLSGKRPSDDDRSIQEQAADLEATNRLLQQEVDQRKDVERALLESESKLKQQVE
jgi:hypothetical protein